jgi:hypothetical protein
VAVTTPWGWRGCRREEWPGRGIGKRLRHLAAPIGAPHSSARAGRRRQLGQELLVVRASGEGGAPNDKANSTIYVARSSDDAQTFTPFVPITSVTISPGEVFPNTRFRDGIVESFAASPTYPNHLYLTYEDWDTVTAQEDVKFTRSTDGGSTWSTPFVVNDAANSATTDQFQPSIAAGPNGAVAVVFYDRRGVCPNDPSVLPADIGQANFCIDTSLQAYKDSGAGAVPVGGNVRISTFTWDPEQPGQHLGGLSQYPCAGAMDPCPTGSGFIGDYFGVAVSEHNIYALMVSTHHPSNVTADEGGPIYYPSSAADGHTVGLKVAG